MLESPGEVQRLTPSIEALYVPDIDRSLDEESAKRDFWRAFRELGTWWARLPSVLSLGRPGADRRGRRADYRPIRRAMGVTAFGVNAYTGRDAGDEVIEPHDEQGHGSGRHEELYVVLTGRAEFDARRRDDRRAGRARSSSPAPSSSAPRKAVAGDDDGARDRRQAGRGGARRSPFEYWYLRDAGVPAEATTHAPTQIARRGARALTRTTRRCSTTSPATRRWPAGLRGRHARIFEVAFANNPETSRVGVQDADLDVARSKSRTTFPSLPAALKRS